MLLVTRMCVCVLSGVQGRLTKTPQNVVVLRGQDATLNCSTDDVSTSGQNPIIWYYDHDIIVGSPCATHNGIFITTLPDATTGCNIRALASYESGISGPYRCSSDRTQALATVIVHGERHNYIISYWLFQWYLHKLLRVAQNMKHEHETVILNSSYRKREHKQ